MSLDVVSARQTSAFSSGAINAGCAVAVFAVVAPRGCLIRCLALLGHSSGCATGATRVLQGQGTKSTTKGAKSTTSGAKSTTKTGG